VPKRVHDCRRHCALEASTRNDWEMQPTESNLRRQREKSVLDCKHLELAALSGISSSSASYT